MSTTAVIYARVSSIGDRQNTDRQISDLLDYVEYQKLELMRSTFLEQRRTVNAQYYNRQLSSVKLTTFPSY